MQTILADRRLPWPLMVYGYWEPDHHQQLIVIVDPDAFPAGTSRADAVGSVVNDLRGKIGNNPTSIQRSAWGAVQN